MVMVEIERRDRVVSISFVCWLLSWLKLEVAKVPKVRALINVTWCLAFFHGSIRTLTTLLPGSVKLDGGLFNCGCGVEVM